MLCTVCEDEINVNRCLPSKGCNDRPSKITQLQDPGIRIQKQVLRLNVTVTDAQGMDVRQTAEQLIHVQFDERNGYRLLLLVVVTSDPVHRLRNELQNQVQVHLVLLCVCCIESNKSHVCQFCLCDEAEGGGQEESHAC